MRDSLGGPLMPFKPGHIIMPFKPGHIICVAATLAAGGPALGDSQPNLPRLEIVDSAVVVRMPPSMTRALNKYDPAFRPWSLREYEDWVLQLYRWGNDHQMPSAVLGDFNGDSTIDVAIEGHGARYAALIVLLSQGKEFSAVELRHTSWMPGARIPGNIGGVTGRNETYMTYVAPGAIQSPMQGTPLDLHTDAFELIYEEKGSELCYYHNGHFEWVTTGD